MNAFHAALRCKVGEIAAVHFCPSWLSLGYTYQKSKRYKEFCYLQPGTHSTVQRFSLQQYPLASWRLMDENKQANQVTL